MCVCAAGGSHGCASVSSLSSVGTAGQVCVRGAVGGRECLDGEEDESVNEV